MTLLNVLCKGDGFTHFDLPEPLGRVGVGICMGEPYSLAGSWTRAILLDADG